MDMVMKIPQSHIDASQREIDKCMDLLTHIANIQKATGDYFDMEILTQKKLLETRFMEHNKFLADAKAANAVDELAVADYDINKLKLNMAERDARAFRTERKLNG